MKFTLAAVSLASLLLGSDAVPLNVRHCGTHNHHHSSSAVSDIAIPTASSSSATPASSVVVSSSTSVTAPISTSVTVSSSVSTSVPAPTTVSSSSSIAAPAPTTSSTAQPTTVSSTVKPTTTSSPLKPSTSSTPTKPTTTSSASAKPTTSTSAAPAPTSTYTGNKKGLAFNAVAATTPFKSSAGWGYNWDSTYQGTYPSGLEFVPMLWSAASDHTSAWDANAKKAIAAGASALLAFNEPDLSSQANMSPSDAAAAWKQYIEPYHGQATLVSPAITNGAPPAMGTGWLDSFITACTSCNIDAIAIHIYDSATNVDYYKNYITDIYTKYKKPVWVTEFGASGSTADQQTFLNTMVPWLEDQTFIARYAYFADISGYMVDSNNNITPVGSTYASAA